MNRGGNGRSKQRKLEALVKELYVTDCTIEDEKLKAILSHGNLAVSHLSKIITKAIDSKPSTNGVNQFVVIHAFYLLAQLKAEEVLEAILEFLSQKQETLDSWMHDLLSEDIWEVIYFLGSNQLDKLEAFILNNRNNLFSRLTVATALIQIALHDNSKWKHIAAIFKKTLRLENDDPDFIGLVASELLDLKDESLRPYIIEALQKNTVWSGLLTPDEVNQSYQNHCTRKMTPLNLFERYEYFRQYACFSKASPNIVYKIDTVSKLEKSH